MTNTQIQASAALRLMKLQADKLKEFSSKREYYRTAPTVWMKDKLGISPKTIKWSLFQEYGVHQWDGTPDPLFRILEAIVNGERRIGVESATGTGKTFLAACIVLWFLDCWESSLVVTSAPKQDQLTLHIWKEIGRLHPRFGKGDLTTLKLRMNPGKDDWIGVGFVAGVKADEDSSTKAQGFHAKHMLIILEETPGIPQPIITAFENTSVAPHNIILALGNPDNQHDNLHRFCTQEGAVHIRVSAHDHPNVVTGNPESIPGATSQFGLKQIAGKYGGEDTPMYKSRARGITPKQASDSLIMMDWVIKCVDLAKDPEKIREFSKGDPALGVDAANSVGGDKASIAEGVGALLLEVEDFQCPDANQLGKATVYERMISKKIKQENVGVDGVGVGAGTVNALKEMGFDIVNLMGGASPLQMDDEEQEFNNLRSQMYWQMREDIKNQRIILPNDTELHADLVTPKWKVKEKYIVVESKEEIKKRLGRSPNKGDSSVYWNWVRQKRTPKMIEFLTWG